MPWEHVEGQDPGDIVLSDLGDSLGLTHRLCILDLGVTNDMDCMRAAKGLLWLAGDVCYRVSKATNASWRTADTSEVHRGSGNSSGHNLRHYTEVK